MALIEASIGTPISQLWSERWFDGLRLQIGKPPRPWRPSRIGFGGEALLTPNSAHPGHLRRYASFILRVAMGFWMMIILQSAVRANIPGADRFIKEIACSSALRSHHPRAMLRSLPADSNDNFC